ncbi:MAG: dUTP diphosphatase [archaeon]
MTKIKLKVKKGYEDLELPKHSTTGSAAVDLRAAIDKIMVLSPGDSALIPTGLFVEIPEGYMMHITPRSGFALKYGISIVNSPGIVDSDYRGEVGVILINHGERYFEIKRGDRIAQATIIKHERAEFEVVDDISETKRGSGGYGHSGQE